MRTFLKLALLAAAIGTLFGCAHNYYNIPQETLEKKVKTIGDAYMVVAGLPYPQADHAERVRKLEGVVDRRQQAQARQGQQHAPADRLHELHAAGLRPDAVEASEKAG